MRGVAYGRFQPVMRSEVIRTPGLLPARIVINTDKEADFSTHLEVIPETGNPYLIRGHYGLSEETALTDFRRRLADLIGV